MSPKIRSVNFPCPDCGARMAVVDSRPTHFHGQDAIRRRRRCTRDGKHRITTMEVIDDGRTDLEELAAAAVMVQAALGDFAAKVRNGKS
jgi:hypothetical protein